MSDLVPTLDSNSEAAVAIAGLEVIGRAGIRAWSLGTHGFECCATYLARTNDIRTCGGRPDFPIGFHSDAALLAKLCLTRLWLDFLENDRLVVFDLRS
jgi:hypothetical protein